MHKLIVDGSYCQDKKMGGVGGYLICDGEYVDSFSHKLNSNIVAHNYELLAIIAGLHLALKNNVKKLHVYSDDQELVTRIRAKNPKFKKSTPADCLQLYSKMKSLTKKFEAINFSIFKCSSAHDLSRIYLKHKKLDQVVKKLESKLNNSSMKLPPKSHKKQEPVITDNSSLYFLDLPEAKSVYVYPSGDLSKKYADYQKINFVMNKKDNTVDIIHNETKLISLKKENNLISLFNYGLCYVSNKLKNEKIFLNLENAPKEYIRYLWSQKKIQKSDLSSFNLLVKFLTKNNCTQIAYSN